MMVKLGRRTPAVRSADGSPQTALRENWLAAAFFTAGLALRVLVIVSYRPVLFYIDTIRYLYDSGGNDPVGYRLPLRAILAVGNFDLLAIIQHLLGLAMAATIYLVLVRRGTHRWLAALAIAPVLLDAYQLQMEQTGASRRLVRGTSRRWHRRPAGGHATRPPAGAQSRDRRRTDPRRVGDVPPGGRDPDPARAGLLARQSAAAGGRC